MATLLIKREQQQQQKTLNDKSKQKQTTAQTKQQQQQQQLHQNNCYYTHYKINKDVKENDDDDEDVGDFYHIKQCYQAATATTKTSTLNQRTNNNNYTIFTTPTTTAASTTSTLSHVLHSLSYNGRHSFVTMLLMACLLLVHYAVAAPQSSCILCDKNDLLAKDPQTNYEEFLFEHQVTRQDAINALRQLNESFYEGTAADSSCNGVRCTEKVMKYCLGPQFINDHCWCEVGHSTEGLPFVPHICYVGEKIYKTSVGSCFFYEEVKDCCCSSILAKEWRHISAGSTVYSKTLFHNYYVLALISLLYLLIRRSYN
ncbi:uncharacterized protein LOC135953977 [Calliphora vicina]|uniref:uncharacterized protein LOC135953977 n=1 Tax=Calliphora vicina TaxID=7373 RepID=UPI00325B6CFF